MPFEDFAKCDIVCLFPGFVSFTVLTELLHVMGQQLTVDITLAPSGRYHLDSMDTMKVATSLGLGFFRERSSVEMKSICQIR